MHHLQAATNGDQRLLATRRGLLAGTLSHKMLESQARTELVLREWPTATLGCRCECILRTSGPFKVFNIVTAVGRTQIVQSIVDKLSNILLYLPLLARLAQRRAEFWTRLSYLLPPQTRTWHLDSITVQGALYSLCRLEIRMEQPEIWASSEAQLKALRVHAYRKMLAARKIGDGGSACRASRHRGGRIRSSE